MSALFEQVKRWFAGEQPLAPGMYQYRTPPDAEDRYRLHLRVEPDGTATVEDDQVMFPNGTVITPDGRTLVVGESFGGCLTAYDVAADGSLSNKRLWAQLPEGAVPDGICLDSQGGIWIASPTTNECIRQVENGEITHRIQLDRGAFACMIGGENLYVLTASSSHPDQCRANRDGRVEVYEAPYAAAGWP